MYVHLEGQATTDCLGWCGNNRFGLKDDEHSLYLSTDSLDLHDFSSSSSDSDSSSEGTSPFSVHLSVPSTCLMSYLSQERTIGWIIGWLMRTKKRIESNGKAKRLDGSRSSKGSVAHSLSPNPGVWGKR